MENMGPVSMDLDPLHILGINIAGDVAALIDDQHCFAGGFRLLGKGSAEQARAYNQIIKTHRMHLSVG